MSIVKSAQLPNVGRCEGGLPMATFERLEPYVGNRPVRFLWGLGPVTDPGYQTSAASVMKPMIIGK